MIVHVSTTLDSFIFSSFESLCTRVTVLCDASQWQSFYGPVQSECFSVFFMTLLIPWDISEVLTADTGYILWSKKKKYDLGHLDERFLKQRTVLSRRGTLCGILWVDVQMKRKYTGSTEVAFCL